MRLYLKEIQNQTHAKDQRMIRPKLIILVKRIKPFILKKPS
jgi:hypothetical protein